MYTGLLLLPRPPIRRLPRLAHRLYTFFGAEQPGGLETTQMTGGHCGQDDGGGGAFVGGDDGEAYVGTV